MERRKAQRPNSDEAHAEIEHLETLASSARAFYLALETPDKPAENAVLEEKANQFFAPFVEVWQTKGAEGLWAAYPVVVILVATQIASMIGVNSTLAFVAMTGVVTKEKVSSIFKACASVLKPLKG